MSWEVPLKVIKGYAKSEWWWDIQMVIPTFSWLERMAKGLWLSLNLLFEVLRVFAARERESIRENQKIDGTQKGKTTSGKKRIKGILLESHEK